MAIDVDLWSAFTGKAELIGARVVRTASAPEVLAEAGPDLVMTSSLGRLGMNRPLPEGNVAAEVAAAGLFAVAETGSVAINESQLDRGACFLAERLWLVVPSDQLEPTLDGALRRIRDLVRNGAHHPLLMSGPSRTADIERVLTIGVHGPRALVVVIVDSP